MSHDFVDLLQHIRSRLGFALPITSGFRCAAYNDEVSSTGRAGPHTTGEAADIGIDRGRCYDVLKVAGIVGFTGIGLDQKGDGRFIHLDTCTESEGHVPRPTIWTY